jgi:hypothetical protein
MKKKVIGIFVFLLLICTIFTVSGQINDISDNAKIVYEKKLGGQKYTVYISGKCFAIGGNESTFDDGPFRINLHWIDYSFEPYVFLGKLFPNSIYEKLRVILFIVDGEIQFLNASYIILENFTGWAPGKYSLIKSLIPLARVRVFGVCDKITILPLH